MQNLVALLDAAKAFPRGQLGNQSMARVGVVWDEGGCVLGWYSELCSGSTCMWHQGVACDQMVILAVFAAQISTISPAWLAFQTSKISLIRWQNHHVPLVAPSVKPSMAASLSDVLTMSVRPWASWSAHPLRTPPAFCQVLLLSSQPPFSVSCWHPLSAHWELNLSGSGVSMMHHQPLSHRFASQKVSEVICLLHGGHIFSASTNRYCYWLWRILGF